MANYETCSNCFNAVKVFVPSSNGIEEKYICCMDFNKNNGNIVDEDFRCKSWLRL